MPDTPSRLQRRRMAACLAALPLAWAWRAGAQTRAQPLMVRIASWDRATNPLIGISEAVLTRLYADIGQPMAFTELPARRASLLLASGKMDANVHRARDYITTHPAVVAVATPLSQAVLRIYTCNPAVAIVDWAGLTGLRVVYPRGVLRVEQLMPAGARRVEAGSAGELWRLLSMDAADVAVISELAGSPIQRPAGIAGLRRLDVVLDEHALHHVLASRHAALAERLNTALQRLLASGDLEALRQSTLQALLKRQGGR